MLSGMDSSSSSSSAGAVRMADMFQKMKHQAHDVDGETATTTTTKTTTTTTSTASSSNDDSHLLVLNRDLKRYELLLEFKNLRNPNHVPQGLYLNPSPTNIHEWHGVLFIHRGYYREGVFKFILAIPPTYPLQPPSIHFTTDMFHPLIDNRDGSFSIKQQFPQWRPRKDYICHILHYLKNCFKEAVMSNLQGESCDGLKQCEYMAWMVLEERKDGDGGAGGKMCNELENPSLNPSAFLLIHNVEQYCLNKESFNMFMTERSSFAKLASQCAQLSSSPDILFDNSTPPPTRTSSSSSSTTSSSSSPSSILFSKLTDQEFEKIRQKVLCSKNIDDIMSLNLMDISGASNGGVNSGSYGRKNGSPGISAAGGLSSIFSRLLSS